MDEEVVPESFVDIANSIKRLKMFPYFEISHYALTCLLVRDDTYSSKIAGPKGFHRNHPLACYIGSLMLCFANSLIGNLLLGEPLLLTFDNEINLIMASVVWYLVNYSPFDFVYHFAKFVPIRIILIMMQEMLRLNRIYDGINFANKNFSGAFLFVCIFGTLKGSATLHIRIFQRLLCGIWLPGTVELFKPSPIAKSSFVAGICFTLQHRNLFEFSDALSYFSLIFLFWVVRLFWIVFGIDIFTLYENILGFLFFGGLLDWITNRRRFDDDKLAMDSYKMSKKHK